MEDVPQLPSTTAVGDHAPVADVSSWPPAEGFNLATARQRLLDGVAWLESALCGEDLGGRWSESELNDALGPHLIECYRQIVAVSEVFQADQRRKTIQHILGQARCDLSPPLRTFRARLRTTELPQLLLIKRDCVEVEQFQPLCLRLDQAIAAAAWRIGFQFDNRTHQDQFERTLLRMTSKQVASQIWDATRIHNRNRGDDRFPPLLPTGLGRGHEWLMRDILNEYRAACWPASLFSDYLFKTDLCYRVGWDGPNPVRVPVQVTSIHDLDIHEKKMSQLRPREHFVELSPVTLAQFLLEEGHGVSRFDRKLNGLHRLQLLAAYPETSSLQEVAQSIADLLRAALGTPLKDARGPLANVPLWLRDLIRAWTRRAALRADRLRRGAAALPERPAPDAAPTPWDTFRQKHPPGSQVDVRVLAFTQHGLWARTAGGIDVFLPASCPVEWPAAVESPRESLATIASCATMPLPTPFADGSWVGVALLDVHDEARYATAVHPEKFRAAGQCSIDEIGMNSANMRVPKPGVRTPGIVTLLQSDGAIVDLGGELAFLPRSPHWEHVQGGAAAIVPGQQLEFLAGRSNGTSWIVLRLPSRIGDDPAVLAVAHPVGSVQVGVVQQVEKTGCMVRFESGMEAHVPREELYWGCHKGMSAVLPALGTSLPCRVIDIDLTAGQLTASARQVHPDPWPESGQQRGVGSQHRGKVLAIFRDRYTVELEGRLLGYVLLSQCLPAVHSPPGAGEELEFCVTSIDAVRQEVWLRRAGEDPSFWDTLVEGQRRQGRVVSCNGLGVQVDVGVVGILRKENMSWGKADLVLARLLPGTEVEVVVLSVNRNRRRLELGMKQLCASPWTSIGERYHPGKVIRGKVCSLTDYGAFIELEDGIYGLVHVSEMSWTRKIAHPSEVVQAGEEIDCVILSIDQEKKHVVLGMKQIKANPWDMVAHNYPPGTVLRGKVCELTSYGALVELQDGIHGLVHKNEMSWKRKITHPSEVVKTGEEIDCMVLSVDQDKKRVALGMKQAKVSPWDMVAKNYPPGTVIRGKVSNLNNYGAFIELEDGIHGLLHRKEMSWTRNIAHPSEVVKASEEIECMVLSVDQEKKRIALGLKQLQQDPWQGDIPARYHIGDSVPGTVTKITSFGVFVELEMGLEALLYISGLADHKVDNPEDVVKLGQRVEVRIIKIDSDERKIGLTLIQAHFEDSDEGEAAPQKEAAERPAPPALDSLADQPRNIGQRMSESETQKKMSDS